MERKQLDLFNSAMPEIHQKENNPESQAHRDQNAEKFSGQCLYVYQLLKQGVVLTRKRAMVDYGIMSLERRVKDLKDRHLISIQSRWVQDEAGRAIYKEYFMKK